MIRLVFVGLSGSGKSTVSQKISSITGINLYDSDLIFVNKTGTSVAEFFKINGEKKFRQIEENIITGILNIDNFILSTGGGAIESTLILKLLKDEKQVVFLDAKVETLCKRLKNDNIIRPLACENCEESMENMRKKRVGLYKSICDLYIDTESISVGEIVEKVLDFINFSAIYKKNL